MGKPRGAKVRAGGIVVPENANLKPQFTHVDWDIGGYFQPASGTRLTVPSVAPGRHIIQVAIRWYNPWFDQGQQPIWNPTLEEVFSSYYYASILVNDAVTGNDARCTMNAVVPPAVGSNQYFEHETDLSAGDYVELRLWQGFSFPDHPVRVEVYFQIRNLETRSLLSIFR